MISIKKVRWALITADATSKTKKTMNCYYNKQNIFFCSSKFKTTQPAYRPEQNSNVCWFSQVSSSRSSCSQIFFKKVVPKNSPIFPGKHLRWNLFSNKASYLSVFSPNAGKSGAEKVRIRTLFTQWTGHKKPVIWHHLVSVWKIKNSKWKENSHCTKNEVFHLGFLQ